MLKTSSAALAAAAMLLTACGVHRPNWQDQGWQRSVNTPGDLAADREACSEEVATYHQPTSITATTNAKPIDMLFRDQSRMDHMVVCMRDKGWLSTTYEPLRRGPN